MEVPVMIPNVRDGLTDDIPQSGRPFLGFQTVTKGEQFRHGLPNPFTEDRLRHCPVYRGYHHRQWDTP
jgi:hypothetical protein